MRWGKGSETPSFPISEHEERGSLRPFSPPQEGVSDPFSHRERENPVHPKVPLAQIPLAQRIRVADVVAAKPYPTAAKHSKFFSLSLYLSISISLSQSLWFCHSLSLSHSLSLPQPMCCVDGTLLCACLVLSLSLSLALSLSGSLGTPSPLAMQHMSVSLIWSFSVSPLLDETCHCLIVGTGPFPMPRFPHLPNKEEKGVSFALRCVSKFRPAAYSASQVEFL